MRWICSRRLPVEPEGKLMAWRGYELTDPPMRGPEVALIRGVRRQVRLGARHGVTEDDVDGTTAAAIEEFQRRVGLPPTGIADFRPGCARRLATASAPRHAG